MIRSLMSGSLSGERSESGKFKGEDQCQAQGGGQNKLLGHVQSKGHAQGQVESHCEDQNGSWCQSEDEKSGI